MSLSDQANPVLEKKRSLSSRIALWIVGFFLTSLVVGGLLLSYLFLIATPTLPDLNAITDYRPKVPLRIVTADHLLIGEFGEEKRIVARFDEIPDVIKKAVLAIEDDRFYQHGGIDYIGVIRAGIVNVMRGGSAQGASTITMQVARNFYLSSKKTYTRKIYEMMLAYKIEHILSKDQILELYMNQIYLGQRAYGFASAAQVYFGVPLKNITLSQAAMLAGLPKAPSTYNPIANPERARQRQRYILKRMLDLGYINHSQYESALVEDVRINPSATEFSVPANYVAEMVRKIMVERFGDDAYTRGFTVVTTIDSADQRAAYDAVRSGVLNYEKRYAYRGPEAFTDLPIAADELEPAIKSVLHGYPDSGNLKAAVVLEASPEKVVVGRIGLTGRAHEANAVFDNLAGKNIQRLQIITINKPGLGAVTRALNTFADAKLKIRRGAIVRVVADANDVWSITQLPLVEGALVALTPQTGAIRALVGGFDFHSNHYNHVTQAWRQSGSSFKPFVYSAALEKGLGPATVVDDGPLYFSAAQTGSKPWAPRNFSRNFSGLISMRSALVWSKNIATVRIMQHIGASYAQQFATKFGFDADKIPPYLPSALGAGSTTPLQLASAYTVFANGGYRVNPFIITEVIDGNGNVISKANPLRAGDNAPRVIDERNAFVMTNLLRDAISQGTGRRSHVLQRPDIAGKTGTTNQAFDTWFAGYQKHLVAVTWMGYDQPRTLGSLESGGVIALPVWIDFMRAALKKMPIEMPVMPEGISTINGELYYSDKTPNNGFVSALDVTDTSVGPPSNDISISPEERQQVIDMFNSD